jgi:hypothetical protein
MDEGPVASFAMEVGLLELCFLDSSGLKLCLLNCSMGDNPCVTVTDKMVIECFVTREAALTVGALKAGNVNVGALVLRKVCGLFECLVVFRAVTVVGCLLMTQTVYSRFEDLSADWTSVVLVCVVLVCVVMVAGMLIFEGRLADADSALARVCTRDCEVKISARLAWIGMRDIASVVREGILALHYRAAVALKEMAKRGSVCVQGLDCRERCSAEAVCSHVRVGGLCTGDTVNLVALDVYRKTAVALSVRDEESKQAVCDMR